MPEVEVGRVSEFFAHPVVAGLDLTASLKVGDRVHIVDHTTDLELVVESMQVKTPTCRRPPPVTPWGSRCPSASAMAIRSTK